MISTRTEHLIKYARAYVENESRNQNDYRPQQIDHWIRAVAELSADRQPWYIRLLSLIGWQPARPLVRSH